MKVVKSVLRAIIFPFAFLFGLVVFLFTGKTLGISYAAFRHYFVLTNGRSNDLISGMISFFRPKYKITTAKGILGVLSEEDIERIAEGVRKDGFYRFDVRLDDATINDLVHFASTTPVSYLDVNRKNIVYSKDRVIFDDKNAVSPRYQFTDNQLFTNKNIERIVFDETLTAVANTYLQTKPVLDIVTMWWSVPFTKQSESAAAQMFHFDMDRFKFIKFFFYLNDVGPENGPHCYIRNSHKRISSQIRKDRRLKDDEIINFYPKEDVIEFTGPKGTIIAVDTRGLHKGKPLTGGKRLLFQIQFSNSLFGAGYSGISAAGLSAESKQKKLNRKRTFHLIKSE